VLWEHYLFLHSLSFVHWHLEHLVLFPVDERDIFWW
jgi:hypothetical protein